MDIRDVVLLPPFTSFSPHLFADVLSATGHGVKFWDFIVEEAGKDSREKRRIVLENALVPFVDCGR